MSLQELEAKITQLPPAELEAFSKWFEEFLEEAWDRRREVESDESPPLSQEWLAEIQRRSQEIDEGLVQPVPFVDPVLRLERLRGCE